MSDLVVISCESLLDIRNSYNETDLKDMTDEWKVLEKSRNKFWPYLRNIFETLEKYERPKIQE